jgi:hypothetical protein
MAPPLAGGGAGFFPAESGAGGARGAPASGLDRLVTGAAVPARGA